MSTAALDEGYRIVKRLRELPGDVLWELRGALQGLAVRLREPDALVTDRELGACAHDAERALRVYAARLREAQVQHQREHGTPWPSLDELAKHAEEQSREVESKFNQHVGTRRHG